MRSWLFILLTLSSGGCTNDYGEFRFPKGTIAPVDAGSNAVPDAGADGD